VHGAQDSSSFILLDEHSKVFKIIYTNCPGNVCPGKWLSGKRPLPGHTDAPGPSSTQRHNWHRSRRRLLVLSRDGFDHADARAAKWTQKGGRFVHRTESCRSILAWVRASSVLLVHSHTTWTLLFRRCLLDARSSRGTASRCDGLRVCPSVLRRHVTRERKVQITMWRLPVPADTPWEIISFDVERSKVGNSSQGHLLLRREVWRIDAWMASSH